MGCSAFFTLNGSFIDVDVDGGRLVQYCAFPDPVVTIPLTFGVLVSALLLVQAVAAVASTLVNSIGSLITFAAENN